MKEIWEQLIKIVPPELLPAIVLVAAAYFGVYYTKGFRDYTDAINDRTFITLTILIAAGFLLFWTNKGEKPEISKNMSTALLVPKFEDDERQGSETLFTQQIQAALQGSETRALVARFNGYIRDQVTAALEAKDYQAAAVIYQPKVVRVKDGIIWCFSVYLSQTESTKSYPPSPAQIDKAILDDLSKAILGSARIDQSVEEKTINTRVDKLENNILELRERIALLKNDLHPEANPVRYRNGYALVVGVDRDNKNQLSQLRYAVSDANSIASELEQWGFQVTELTNEAATKQAIEDAVNSLTSTSKSDDVVVFYYSGSTFASDSAFKAQSENTLILPTADLDLHDRASALGLETIVSQLQGRPVGDVLVILDGCHGTVGIEPKLLDLGKKGSRSIQIMSGSQDSGFGLESEQYRGGAFTQSLLYHIKKLGDDGASTRELINSVKPELLLLTHGQQEPKLVTLGGTRDITFGPIRAETPQR